MAVQDGVEFGSNDFWTQFKAQTVERRMSKAHHKFSSTIHVLVSAAKKLQRTISDTQGAWLFRGLGGLDVSDFIAGVGFTERAFTSTTKSLEVALDYSGAKPGTSGTVLVMEVSEVDHGAVLKDFSQYPGEEETLWNSCSYMEASKGREQWHITKEGLVVKIVEVKMNASGRAFTVEELEERRKTIAVNMLETIHSDICRDLRIWCQDERFVKKAEEDARFRKRMHGENVDIEGNVEKFVQLAIEGSSQVVARYDIQNASWFHKN